MLSNVMLCNVMLCYVTLYYVNILYYVILGYVASYCVMFANANNTYITYVSRTKVLVISFSLYQHFRKF